MMHKLVTFETYFCIVITKLIARWKHCCDTSVHSVKTPHCHLSDKNITTVHNNHKQGKYLTCVECMRTVVTVFVHVCLTVYVALGV